MPNCEGSPMENEIRKGQSKKSARQFDNGQTPGLRWESRYGGPERSRERAIPFPYPLNCKIAESRNKPPPHFIQSFAGGKNPLFSLPTSFLPNDVPPPEQDLKGTGCFIMRKLELPDELVVKIILRFHGTLTRSRVRR